MLKQKKNVMETLLAENLKRPNTRSYESSNKMNKETFEDGERITEKTQKRNND